MNYTAANGQELTDAMIEEWCACYERGEFPAGEHSVGEVVMGRPPLSSEKTATLTVKMPIGMKEALVRRAEREGVTASAYTRSVLADSLVAASD